MGFDGNHREHPHDLFEFVGKRLAQLVFPLRKNLACQVLLDFCCNHGG